MTPQVDKDRAGRRRHVVRSATRAQIKAARMLLAREKRGLASPSAKARAVAELDPNHPVAGVDCAS